MFYANQCLGSCQNVSNVNLTAQSIPINGACICNNGFYWSTANQNPQCLSCGDYSTNLTQCQSSQCAGYFWTQLDTGGFCTNCASLGATVSINGSCNCPSGQFWDVNSKYCYLCSAAPLSLCTVGYCANYFVDYTGSNCQPCGANTVNRLNSTPATACTCAQGFVWVNGSCTICNVTQGQYLLNPTSCYSCPFLNGLTNGSALQSNSSGCLCVKNYQFLPLGALMQCTCNNILGFFDLGGSQGCGSCLGILGAISYNQTSSTCNCISLLIWNAILQQCVCPANGTYFKFGFACISCYEIPTNAGPNPLSATSCLCISGATWNSSYSQCICKGTNGTIPNRYYNGSACVLCGVGTLGIIDGYSRCLCPNNSYWNSNIFSCVCAANYIPVNQVCTSCLSIQNGVSAASATECACAPGWTWSTLSNSCQCANTTCNCSSVSNTAFNFVSKTCQPCSSFDLNANPLWPTGQQQCSCKGAFMWTFNNATNKYSCQCPSFNASSPIIKVNISCVLCDRLINSFNSGVSNGTIQKCNCFPNYIWSTSFLLCSYSPTNKLLATVQFLSGANVSCTSVLTSAVTTGALDNFNCLCANGSAIFNDLTGSCIFCPLGTVNAVTCKCPVGQAWNIFLMACSSVNPPLGQFNNQYYAKCIQSLGIVSGLLVAYSPADLGQVFVSGESAFAGLASASAIYAGFSSFKCNCASGYGWNAARKRCYPMSWNYVY